MNSRSSSRVSVHEFGPGLKQVLENEAGDFTYIKTRRPRKDH